MVNEGIIGIESREREFRVVNETYYPYVSEGCFGARDKELRNNVCNQDYAFCSQYSERIAEIDIK